MGANNDEWFPRVYKVIVMVVLIGASWGVAALVSWIWPAQREISVGEWVFAGVILGAFLVFMPLQNLDDRMRRRAFREDGPDGAVAAMRRIAESIHSLERRLERLATAVEHLEPHEARAAREAREQQAQEDMRQ